MIQHTVAFSLRHEQGSEQETAFMKAALVLAEIPVVRNFRQCRQTSPKSSFDFGFSMEFEDQAAYDAYNSHPLHDAFVRDRWVPEVTDFQELDYEAYP